MRALLSFPRSSPPGRVEGAGEIERSGADRPRHCFLWVAAHAWRVVRFWLRSCCGAVP